MINPAFFVASMVGFHVEFSQSMYSSKCPYSIAISCTRLTGPSVYWRSSWARALSEKEEAARPIDKIIVLIILSMGLAASSFSLNARAQDERQYTEGPVSLVQEIAIEYGHFEEYIDWLNSTWKPTMEATKKAGIIIDYKVFSSTPPSPDHPDVILWITYKNMAALDKGVEEEAVAKKVIGSTEFQNKKRVERSEYRKVLRREYIRELILK